MLCLKFEDEHFDRTVMWWPSTRREVMRMAAVLPLAFADVGAPISKVLWATDARGAEDARGPGDCGAFGVVACELPESLAEACYERARSLVRTVSRLDGSVLALRDPSV